MKLQKTVMRDDVKSSYRIQASYRINAKKS